MSTNTACCQHYLAAKQALVEERLEQLVAESHETYRSLYQAARYSLLAPGKRLRPILALATNEVLGGNEKAALSACCVLELVHTYSLIHDDLPAMDNDDFRRGKPSLHKAYNEGLAILAGDFLLTHAFQLLARDENIDNEQKVKLIGLLAEGAGGEGMIAGQVLDIEAQGKAVNIDFLQAIHRKKTGALIAVSVEFGAILAKGTENDLHALRQFGKEIGLAFQIADDIIDVTNSEEKHGKKISSDVANKKITYVSLLGLEEARKQAKLHRENAIQALDGLSKDASLLKTIADSILKI